MNLPKESGSTLGDPRFAHTHVHTHTYIYNMHALTHAHKLDDFAIHGATGCVLF